MSPDVPAHKKVAHKELMDKLRKDPRSHLNQSVASVKRPVVIDGAQTGLGERPGALKPRPEDEDAFDASLDQTR